MSKAVIVVILGIIVALIPIDGLPERISAILTVLLGLAIAALGLLMRVERIWLMRTLSGGHKTDAYAENSATQTNPDPRV
jgi:hypothetical protein